jgi:NAD(P)-dependent dehydrogenase (short-subunit alcohol dehydrogenase family)
MSYAAFSIRMVVLLLMFSAPVGGLQAAAGETVLITGANRGIGLALAERFKQAGYEVIGTARKPETATELKALGARVEQLDVTDQASVDAMAARLDGVIIDFLVNNAGIKGHDDPDLANLQVDRLEVVFNVNTLGPLRVTQALFENVKSSNRKVVANVSSMMGSIERNTWGCCLGYRASKSALNSFTKTLSVDYADRGMVFVTLHPGYVQTDMNDGRGNITPAQSADGLFRLISGLKSADNGHFYNYDGKEMPW